MKKKIALFVFIGLIIISLFFLIRYVIFTTKYTTSDAAFIKSDTLTYLSFKLPGKLDILSLNSGDMVKKGELLAKLSTKELNTTLKEINFNILAMQNKITASQALKQKLISDMQLNIQLNNNENKILDKNVLSLSFIINAMNIKLLKSYKDLHRYKVLYKYHKTSLEHLETIQTAYKSLKNQILSKQNDLAAMELSKKSLILKTQIIKNEKYNIIKISKSIASLTNSKSALLQQARLIHEKITDSYIYAPFDGTIAKKFVNNHEVVSAAENIVGEVDLKHIYVSVLLEESKLKSLKVGNSATVHIDALDKDFKAKISKILPASASTFAIVPRDISSGEFTKLQQRFIVKLRFLQPIKNLRIGMSAEVTINR